MMSWCWATGFPRVRPRTPPRGWAAGHCLLARDLSGLADLSLNARIGGPARGILVREVDALGGLSGRAGRRTGHYAPRSMRSYLPRRLARARAAAGGKLIPRVGLRRKTPGSSIR